MSPRVRARGRKTGGLTRLYEVTEAGLAARDPMPEQNPQDRIGGLDRGPSVSAHLRLAAHPGAIGQRYLVKSQTAARGLDDQLDRPAVGRFGHAKSDQIGTSDCFARRKVGDALAPERGNYRRGKHIPQTRVDRHRAALDVRSSSENEVGPVVDQREDDPGKLAGIVAAVAIQKRDDLGLGRVDAGRAGPAITAPALDDTPRSGGLGDADG